MAMKATCDVARFSKFQFRLQPDSSLLMATVLIADDSRVHVHLLTGWLQDLGLEVIATFDAIQAWVTAMRTQPNMIILDINMPGGSGIEVLKRLKNSAKTRDIPVLVISGNAEVRLRAPNWDYAYVADIYIPQRRIVIEVDGPSHFGRGWRDRIRDIKLRRDLGLRTVRIKNSEVEKNEDQAARKLDRISYYR